MFRFSSNKKNLDQNGPNQLLFIHKYTIRVIKTSLL
jgi:hypothetical protein